VAARIAVTLAFPFVLHLHTLGLALLAGLSRFDRHRNYGELAKKGSPAIVLRPR
jgi:hypothetical protein